MSGKSSSAYLEFSDAPNDIKFGLDNLLNL